MGSRVAFLAAECEPWAKTGGLADVVDALARALGRSGPAAIDAPVDVFLPRYRSVPEPATIERETILRVPDPRARAGSSEVRVIDVPADGYRLRLVDHQAAFDREGFYGDAAGDYADNAWRFGLFTRTALEALRADGRPLDVLHTHDWHTGPVAILRSHRYTDDPIVGGAAMVHTLHNLAYHGWVPNAALAQLGLRPGDDVEGQTEDGVDLLLAGIEGAEIVNTVSPGYAAEALTPAFGMGLDRALRARGDRFIGILNGLDTTVWDPATDRELAATYSRADRSGKRMARADLLRGVGFDPDDDGPVIGLIGRLDPQKGFDTEEEMLEAIRATVGPSARIRIDANEAWSVPEAVRLLTRWHARFDIDFVEAPVRATPHALMLDLRQRVPVALCANEGLDRQADALAMIESHAADILCFSSYWVGSLRRFHTLSHVAALHGQRVIKHTHGEFGIAAAAGQHVMLALPNVDVGVQQTAAMMEDDILADRLPIADGPDWGLIGKSGLGIEIDEDKLARYVEAYRKNGQFLPN